MIEKKRSSKYSVALGKGFYFSKKYHLLRFNSDFSAKFDKFPTFTPEERMYNVDQYQYGFSTGIEPKGFFLMNYILKCLSITNISFLATRYSTTINGIPMGEL